MNVASDGISFKSLQDGNQKQTFSNLQPIGRTRLPPILNCLRHHLPEFPI
ncbi:hypothetical protein NEICINOT_03933 [Neisseria cinerea ATCC 14685]|uniref:Uncharacterized protein n=1 Tax=Neisseria cinerea ATCC 14685 TaxID=546262 RepID=D0W2Q0_NEICI|nr:hypothetical protein NEICINOT_03933 [Neisseria cinerea ATCC 14685]